MARKDNAVKKVVGNVGYFNIRMITTMTEDKDYRGRVPRLLANSTTYGIFNKKKLLKDGFKNEEVATDVAKKMING